MLAAIVLRMLWSTLSLVGQVIWVNLLLSADNVVVIAAVAHELPPSQKRAALVGGTFLAVVMLITLTALVATAMTVKGLQAAGGIVLLPIAARLTLNEPDDTKPRREGKVTSAVRAILLILLANLAMSIDNILAVAAVAKNNLVVLATGLVVSVTGIMVFGGMVAALIDRWKWLTYVGAAFLAFTAGRMIVGDALVASWLPAREWIGWVGAGIAVVVVLSVPTWWPPHRRRGLHANARSDT
jgi:YjbE family integral membrane protein